MPSSNERVEDRGIDARTKHSWFSTISFDTVLQVVVFVVTTTFFISRLQSSQENEQQLRAELEKRTFEVIASVRESQSTNFRQVEQRFSENAVRDRDTLTEVKAGLNRLNEKVDALISSQMTMLQQQRERVIR